MVKLKRWDEEEDLDIGDLDLEGIEKSYVDVEHGYVSQVWVILLKEEIIKARKISQLGFNP